MFCREYENSKKECDLGSLMQVSGVLVEDGYVVLGLEIKGQWDQGLSVRHPDGSERSLWNYKQPELLDSR